jgi:oligoribonuclease (3'-5' exoribonuclease)
MPAPRFLFWTDFESTGLPVRNDFTGVHILEVAVIVTDLNLNPVGGLTEVIDMTAEAATAIKANPYVKDMHTRSGLLKESIENARAGRGMTEAKAEQAIIDLLAEHSAPDDFIIAGSGVAAFDHPLIKERMRDLATWLVYYPFDIGVMRRTARILTGKEIVTRTDSSYGDTKAHRALADVKGHLEEAKKYQDVLREKFA